MPKGDKENLKADPEDGTTPIANLLLDAFSVVKLSGKELRACLYLCRRTYGWQINGSRLKEAKIPFKEWSSVLQTDASHTSNILSGLAQKNIIIRRYLGPAGQGIGYYYSINTIVAEWCNSCLNLQLLRKTAMVTLPKTATVTLPKTASSTDTDLASGKASLKQSKGTGTDIINSTVEPVSKTKYDRQRYSHMVQR